MDVLYFADTRFPIERANGLQTMATCHALARRGHSVTLAVRPDTTAPSRDPFAFYGFAPEPRLAVLTIPTTAGRTMSRLAFFRHALRLVRRSPKAIVYTRDLGLAAAIVALPGAMRPRVVYESHGIAPLVSAEMPRLLGTGAAPSRAKLNRLERRERLVWQRAHAYVTITRALADDLAERYGPRDRVFVVPDGARDSGTGIEEPREMANAVAGYAGHLYPWKGVDVFVQAIARVPGLRGLIVGGHPAEADRARVEALAREIDVCDRIEITGLVAPPEVNAHLSRASILVLPNTATAISERFTSPLKLFEYLWLGRPIVASDLPSLREVLTDGETALFVPPGDAEALAGGLRRLLQDPDLAARLGRAARALAPSYTWNRRAERLEEALEAART